MTTLLLFYLSYISAPEQHYEYLVAIAIPIAQQNRGSLSLFFFKAKSLKTILCHWQIVRLDHYPSGTFLTQLTLP